MNECKNAITGGEKRQTIVHTVSVKSIVVIKYQLEKVAIVNALQLEATRHCGSRSGLFWGENLYCTCTQTSIFQLQIKILISSLDSATPIY